MHTPLTLGAWLGHWISFYAPLRCTSGVTLERYQRLANYVRNAATPELGELCGSLLTDITHQTLESALLSLLTAKAQRKEHLSKRSVRHTGALISSALAKAVRLDLIPFNPMAKVELPAAEKPQVRSLSLCEVQRLRLACRGDWTFVFAELALASGCRRGELLALTYDDISHYNRILSVTKSLEQTSRGLRLKLPKNGRPRRCTLPHAVMLLLPQYGMKGERNEGLLFPGPDGKWRSPALVSQTIVRRLRKAGIENASLHSLRHTHASEILSRGIPVTAVAARLGHSDANITLRTYGHAMPPDDHRAADAWDAVLAGM